MNEELNATMFRSRLGVEVVSGAWPADTDAPRKGRLLVDAWSAKLTHDVLQLARLLVSELIALSVRGGPGTGPESDVTMTLELGETSLRAEVLAPTETFSFPDATADTADLSLSLLDELADRWGMSRTERGTACWVEIDC